MCESSVSAGLYPEAARRAATPRDVVRVFVKHERFRCETDVKVAEIQKALSCDYLAEFITNVFALHNWEKSDTLTTRPALNDCLT